jgi:hypothetical protein
MVVAIYGIKLILAAEMSPDAQKFVEAHPDLSGEEFAKKMIDQIVSGGRFDIEKKIVIMDPTSTAENADTLIAGGIPARVASVNDNFSENDQDIALLKIEENNLPSLKLGDGAGSVPVGSKVFAMGFPASADFNGKNYLEA